MKYFLLILMLISSTISDHVIGIKGLNPENDPIYDPVTGRLSIISTNDPIHLPAAEISPTGSSISSSSNFVDISSSQSPPSMFHTIFPSNSTDSEPVLASPAFSVQIPQNNNVHIPEKSLKQKKLWNFHYGYPEEFNPVFGCTGFLSQAREMFSDLNLSQSEAVYSLISIQYSNPQKLAQVLPYAHALEIYCPYGQVFSNLHRISMNFRSIPPSIISINLIFKRVGETVLIQIVLDESIKVNKFLRKEIIDVARSIAPSTGYHQY